eukprot:1795822-Karenia_brevis.AAC.1
MADTYTGSGRHDSQHSTGIHTVSHAEELLDDGLYLPATMNDLIASLSASLNQGQISPRLRSWCYTVSRRISELLKSSSL